MARPHANSPVHGRALCTIHLHRPVCQSAEKQLEGARQRAFVITARSAATCQRSANQCVGSRRRQRR
ncbi:hypothetical protein FKM82_016128 [Ascaphus truei]